MSSSHSLSRAGHSLLHPFYKALGISSPSQKLLQKLDIFLLILFPILAVALSLIFQANFLTSIFLFLGLPSLWLSWRTPAEIKKTLLFSAIFAIPLGIILDYIATKDGAWFTTATVFPFRVFALFPVEDIIWFFGSIYAVVIFYKHFLDQGKSELLNEKMKYLLWPLAILSFLFCAVLFFKPALLALPYAYLVLGGGFFFLPAIAFLLFFPKLLAKYVQVGAYFFLVSISFELTALALHHWTFPGTHFIGWVQLFAFKFPFEEFFFWFLTGAISVLSYYEFFDDDRK